MPAGRGIRHWLRRVPTHAPSEAVKLSFTEERRQAGTEAWHVAAAPIGPNVELLASSVAVCRCLSGGALNPSTPQRHLAVSLGASVAGALSVESA